jgi:hypothetical protein
VTITLHAQEGIASTLDFQTDAVYAKTPKVVELKLRIRERAALLKNYLVGNNSI